MIRFLVFFAWVSLVRHFFAISGFLIFASGRPLFFNRRVLRFCCSRAFGHSICWCILDFLFGTPRHNASFLRHCCKRKGISLSFSMLVILMRSPLLSLTFADYLCLKVFVVKIFRVPTFNPELGVPACLCLCARVLACLRACVFACLCASVPACLCASVPACFRARVPACLHACLLACLLACVPAYQHASVLACLRACVSACLGACLHALRRVDACACVHVCSCFLLSLPPAQCTLCTCSAPPFPLCALFPSVPWSVLSSVCFGGSGLPEEPVLKAPFRVVSQS